jgi:hypothetical protein
MQVRESGAKGSILVIRGDVGLNAEPAVYISGDRSFPAIRALPWNLYCARNSALQVNIQVGIATEDLDSGKALSRNRPTKGGSQ